MQKKLIALAVAGLASTAAFAQSNVTIYGILDASVMAQSNHNAGSSYGFGSSNFYVSRLGFKGSEALGNGLSATFQLEEEINLASGAQGSGAAGNNFGSGGVGTFSRAANVGLASNSWGALTFGRQATPTFLTVFAADVLGADSGGLVNAWVRANNYAVAGVGNVITGSTLGANVIGTQVNAGTTAPNGGLTLPGAFAAGIGYATPVFSGFQAKLFVNAGNGMSGASYDNAGIRDISLAYNNFGFGVNYSHQEVSQFVTATATGYAGVSTATKGDNLGVAYTFGQAKIAAAYSTLRFDAGAAGATGIGQAYADDSRIWSLGGTYKLGATTLGLSYTDVRDTTNTANKARNWTAMADYALSKRTSAYALLTSVNNSGATSLNGLYNGSAVGNTTATSLDGRNGTSTGLAVGLRHSF